MVVVVVVVVDDGQDGRPPCLCCSEVDCQRGVCTATSARLLKNRKTTAGNNKSKRLDKSGLYPQKSRINMKNVNVCSGGEKDRKTS